MKLLKKPEEQYTPEKIAESIIFSGTKNDHLTCLYVFTTPRNDGVRG
jgi:hypothetical protein